MEVPPPTAEPLRQLDLPSGTAVQNINKCEGENMKRKTMALMLALSMCLSLLSACGSGNTATSDKPPESENAASSTEQQPEESEKPEESKEQPEESEKPKEEEPEESEEPKKENNAGTEFLALLQEEYKAGVTEGFTQEHIYLNTNDTSFPLAWIDRNGETIYSVWPGDGFLCAYSYDISTKKVTEYKLAAVGRGILDGWIYTWSEHYENFIKLKPGEETVIVSGADNIYPGGKSDGNAICLGDKIVFPWEEDSRILSLDSGLVDVVPHPQKEVEHGLTEPVALKFGRKYLVADGTVYATGENHLYRLDAESLEWIDLGSDNGLFDTYYYKTFYGKYYTDEKGVYNRISGEQVFEYGELYPSASLQDNTFCYWGGEKYLGYKDGEYRWVNLTDLSMSDPLLFPEGTVTIVNDTYCAYYDNYGIFLRNYIDGTEETIVLFDK